MTLHSVPDCSINRADLLFNNVPVAASAILLRTEVPPASLLRFLWRAMQGAAVLQALAHAMRAFNPVPITVQPVTSAVSFHATTAATAGLVTTAKASARNDRFRAKGQRKANSCSIRK
jgi:hypothetical protein